MNYIDWRRVEIDDVRTLAAYEFTRRQLGYTEGESSIGALGRTWALDELIDHLGIRDELERNEAQRKPRAAHERIAIGREEFSQRPF